LKDNNQKDLKNDLSTTLILVEPIASKNLTGLGQCENLLGQQNELLIENHVTKNDTRVGQKFKFYAFEYVM